MQCSAQTDRPCWNVFKTTRSHTVCRTHTCFDLWDGDEEGLSHTQRQSGLSVSVTVYQLHCLFSNATWHLDPYHKVCESRLQQLWSGVWPQSVALIVSVCNAEAVACFLFLVFKKNRLHFHSRLGIWIELAYQDAELERREDQFQIYGIGILHFK